MSLENGIWTATGDPRSDKKDLRVAIRRYSAVYVWFAPAGVYVRVTKAAARTLVEETDGQLKGYADSGEIFVRGVRA